MWAAFKNEFENLKENHDVKYFTSLLSLKASKTLKKTTINGENECLTRIEQSTCIWLIYNYIKIYYNINQ